VKLKIKGALAALVWAAGLACGERTPTSVDEALFPVAPVTVEVRLDWEDFASNLEIVGGYGSPQQLGTGIAAHAFGDSLEGRTLVRFARFPTSASVQDSTGTTRVDSLLTILSGRVVARIDTVASVHSGPVTLGIGATLQQWDPRTASWEMAVDSVADQRPWQEPGGGPVTALATTVWDPVAGDTAVFELDSAQVALWADTADVTRGARLDALSENVRLKVDDVSLRIDVRPSVNQDTVVTVTATRQLLTFVYSPTPDPPPDGIRLGGAPAWRTVLDLRVPARLNGPESLCQAVGCPAAVTSDRLNYAALVLTTRRTDLAFQPTDSVGIDVRPVLRRSALPKSPLGSSLVGGLGKRVSPDLFGEGEGAEVEIPITGFLRAILEDETDSGAAPRTLALLSAFEPISLTFASFFGPGTSAAPELKLVVTAGPSVQLP
jgi:hypothetical protein